MDYFYDGQVRRYLTQFMRIMSNFSYKDAKGQLVRVPVRYGDMNRQVAQILNKNSENAIPSAPFIACYIKELVFDRTRLQDPTFVSKINIREREFNDQTQSYMNVQAANYTVERIMPSPHLITFHADIWTTNTEQKLQLWEQIAVLFNPSMELQTTDNYIDWTSLSVLTLENQTWSSRQIPQGVEQDIDILNMVFKSPIWITPPAKVKQLGIITKIITDVHSFASGEIATEYGLTGAIDTFATTESRVVIAPGGYNLMVADNGAILLNLFENQGDSIDPLAPGNMASWYKLLDLYPGQFKANLSQLRLKKSNGGEIIAYISVDPFNDTRMALNIDQETIPSNSEIAGRTTIDAIINPETFNPLNRIVAGTRYLILEDINRHIDDDGYTGPIAWKNADQSDFRANANDIIEWNGSTWNVIFNSEETADVIYITNSYTGVQYKWEYGSWAKSFEGLYNSGDWRLIL